MATHRSIAFSIAIVTAVLMAVPRYAAQNEVAGNPLQQFNASVAAYMRIHRDVERGLPALDVSRDARQIYEAVEARAAAIRRARADAAAGDIFTAGVRDLLCTRIRRAVQARGGSARHLLQDMYEEGEPWNRW